MEVLFAEMTAKILTVKNCVQETLRFCFTNNDSLNNNDTLQNHKCQSLNIHKPHRWAPSLGSQVLKYISQSDIQNALIIHLYIHIYTNYYGRRFVPGETPSKKLSCTDIVFSHKLINRTFHCPLNHCLIKLTFNDKNRSTSSLITVIHHLTTFHLWSPWIQLYRGSNGFLWLHIKNIFNCSKQNGLSYLIKCLNNSISITLDN
jgi:hypothetical protein